MSTGATERTLLDALHGRLTQRVNGMTPRSVLATHVRHNPAYGHSIADAISIDTWASAGYALHGYEVKVSRSDYRREVRDLTKSETWRQHCTWWWIVTLPGIARDDLPEGWGLLTLQGRWLRQQVRATRNPTPTPLTPSALAGLLRATAQTAAHYTLTPAERLLLARDTTTHLDRVRERITP